MSTYFYLVCLETMQSIEVAASIGGMDGGSVRSTQEPKALAMFCIAHAGTGVEMMSDDQLEGRNRGSRRAYGMDRRKRRGTFQGNSRRDAADLRLNQRNIASCSRANARARCSGSRLKVSMLAFDAVLGSN